ncbi:aminotransferase class V-fold PLP-dependent enzyme [Lacticaseibacillus baoqingensis]|uniref:cysteine desulfurase n=1 Tax=Lacticaseibacillus baoqingensis TaxID=2486013 RepID=A0ABW4E6Z3_9LACO|nr:SufS family cysteine desulfurase [Lacticaseibacillus baoqingensis]
MREQFPFFKANPDLVYLDSAATSQKPQVVLDALQNYYVNDNANVHRGLYRLAYNTTEAYEGVRAQVAKYLHAKRPEEITFTRSTTDGLNLVASSFGPTVVQPGDEILVSGAEHHSNFIPWQQLAHRTGATFVVAPVKPDGDTDVDQLAKLITNKTKILAVAQVTNVSGGLVDVRPLADKVHANGGYIVVDGAQAVPHMPVDVQAIDADFYSFSGHKVYGPTGIGALYGRYQFFEAMPPIQYGGEMIDEVQDQVSTWAEVPLKFEAGTPNIAGVFGLGAALDFMSQLDLKQMMQAENTLVKSLRAELSTIDGIILYGSDASLSTVSFNLTGVHPHDLATFLDEQDVAVRAGHHCAQPLMARLGIPATARASFGIYNTQADVDKLVAAVRAAGGYFHGTN